MSDCIFVAEVMPKKRNHEPLRILLSGEEDVGRSSSEIAEMVQVSLREVRKYSFVDRYFGQEHFHSNLLGQWRVRGRLFWQIGFE